MRGRPMGMGMGARGGMINRGGAPLPSRLPPSLQAKMDKVSERLGILRQGMISCLCAVAEDMA